MVETLWLVLFLIALAVTALLAYPYVAHIPFVARMTQTQKIPQPGVVKHDWLPTGRIDFATRLDEVNVQNKEQPREFKLLGEERRIVESIAGNENLEIQWRLATLSEAKTVVTQYHKYLSENSLIKSIPELFALSSLPMTAEGSASVQPHLSIVDSTKEASGTASDAPKSLAPSRASKRLSSSDNE
jgi:hypothetical protein